MAQEEIVNGIDVDQLLGTIEEVRKNPDMAQFIFRTTNVWIDGTRNRAVVRVSTVP